MSELRDTAGDASLMSTGAEALRGAWVRGRRLGGNEGFDACLMTLQGHTDRVTAVGWSPDGRRIVSGAWDESVKVWDTKTYELLQTINVEGDISCISFGPNSKLAVANRNNISIFIDERERQKNFRIVLNSMFKDLPSNIEDANTQEQEDEDRDIIQMILNRIPPDEVSELLDDVDIEERMTNEEIIAALGPERVKIINELIEKEKEKRKAMTKVFGDTDLSRKIGSFLGGKTKRRKNRKVKGKKKTIKRKRTR